MNKRLLLAGWGTLLVFPVLGWFILQFFEDDPLKMMVRGQIPLILQLVYGLGLGVVFGKIASWVISLPALRDSSEKYVRMISTLNLRLPAILFLSFCAGFGEEFLFRGAIQPLLGIWLTAIIFVAIHGYINPLNWRISVYGVAMTGIIACLGWMTEIWGIFSACAAHMAIDVVLFTYLAGRSRQNNFQNQHA